MSSSARAFLADLAKARETQYDSISGVRRGDSDGEVSLLYSNDSLEEPLEIKILSMDVTSYPDDSCFMVFTSSETCDTKVLSLLELISSSTRGSTLHEVIQTVSDQLTASFDDTLESGFGSSASPDQDTPDYEFYDSFEISDDEAFPQVEKSRADGKLCKDLKTAKEAGVTVGIFPNTADRPLEVISLSIRISKLGITSETMHAWDIKVTDYIVLLMRLPNGYPSIATLLHSSRTHPVVQFRFGRCSSAKPSIESVRLAFQYSPAATKNSDNPDSTLPAFSSVSYGHTWDEAQATMHEYIGRIQSEIATENNMGLTGASHEIPISTHAPSSLQHDFALDDEASISFPLVAMQFALRRFCKCTEYCIVCHLKLQTDFVPLKPYVCAKDLCLYQYLALGLGPNIEHEVISSPYVVDLLISFFYTGETQRSIREFPCGLALRAPVIQQSAPHLQIETCIQFQQFRILLVRNEPMGTNIRKRMRNGDWFAMLTNKAGSIEKHTCYVSETLDDGLYKYETTNSIIWPKNRAEISISELIFSTAVPSKKDFWQSGFIFPYEHDVDNLDADQRAIALTELLDNLPSVLQMRSYLLDEPGRMLSSWKRINPSALSLMRWIVASNTSYIVQDGPVPSKDLAAHSSNENPRSAAMRKATSNLIRPLENGWMQFRFAQGSPEKEYAFLKTLQEMKSKNQSTAKPPSLFVWHGSPISNWHSIIRAGLDFQQTRHGRSYGHGVYFSKHMEPFRHCWMGSELRISLALSICEIVNRPEEFVASHPHFVVDKEEWIQCRYLLIQIDPTENALKNPLFAPSGPECTGYIQQDPEHCIMREYSMDPLQIPLSALSIARQQEALGLTLGNTALGSITAVTNKIDDESCDSDSGDHPDILVDDILKLYRAHESRKRQRSTSPEPSSCGLASSPSPWKSTKWSEIGKKNTRSTQNMTVSLGSLDYKTIPQLPPPSWATSSPMALQTLTRELKHIHTIQSQNHAASLGWSVDTLAIDNLFQWIVQFHSFDSGLPLAMDMKSRGLRSIVLEVRFGSNFPMSPPFVRIIRPRFLPFLEGGGGHVTAGGAICSEMLTNSGWSPAMSMEMVFLQIRLGLCDTERPARLDTRQRTADYGIAEAVAAYIRAAVNHGWDVPEDLENIHAGWLMPPAS
ncbi:poly(ADP-ribose) polymerase and ubiquitin-conjugating domain protein [Metarhizium robertsii]|uniref:Poly(ADP-ribose) polymerase and ubiquitin-conjugating domain protein n=1 Tax=Metarhizium robertsii TaxID=568076 RepID=A0A014QY14_9HYPO|nr:poly(ADP-ribose) polymerase and ubiquitin-conjugating domain protein [Metarhizium robertsii]